MSASGERFELMGIEPSPYTVKVQSYLRFKDIPFDWVTRNLKTEKRFQRHARVQLIPMLFFPGGEAMQDSTLIMERLEGAFPDPSMHPEDPALRFLSDLLEEFGDEWCNKLMFFQRWFLPRDQKATGNRIANAQLEGQWYRSLVKPVMSRLVVRRMVPRLALAGANETNIPHLKRSFENLVALLDRHLSTRAFLLGGRPSFGDFGIWGNLYQAWSDPTAGDYIRGRGPHLTAWIERMQNPKMEGGYEALDALRPTLLPILQEEVGQRFLAWSDANAKAWEAGEATTSLEIGGDLYQQKTFKYHAFSLGELRKKFDYVRDVDVLTELLDKADCLDVLARN